MHIRSCKDGIVRLQCPCSLPSITPPDLTVIPHILGDAAAISVVILVVSISMGKVFSKKHKYEINVRQVRFMFFFVFYQKNE